MGQLSKYAVGFKKIGNSTKNNFKKIWSLQKRNQIQLNKKPSIQSNRETKALMKQENRETKALKKDLGRIDKELKKNPLGETFKSKEGKALEKETKKLQAISDKQAKEMSLGKSGIFEEQKLKEQTDKVYEDFNKEKEKFDKFQEEKTKEEERTQALDVKEEQ